MTKILLIGKKSFLGSNLKLKLSQIYKVDNYSHEEIIKKNLSFIKNYSYVINTAIHSHYVNNKYNKKYDLDRMFIEKFHQAGFFYIFLNTRKIYYPRKNISERSKLMPIDNYAKNKLTTEKFLKMRLRKKLISLRISNVIGKRIFKNARNHHNLFFDNYLKFKKETNVISINDDFKDFLSVEQFCKIIIKIIKLKVSGIYNVSIGQRIYVSQIIKWIDVDFFKKIKFLKSSNNSFFLSNSKLVKKTKIKLTKNQLKKFCNNLFL